MDQQYVATLQTLEAALTAACTDFQPEPYTQASSQLPDASVMVP